MSRGIGDQSLLATGILRWCLALLVDDDWFTVE
jgi:hypothetical protein